jgi:hypothetical protein
MSAVKASRPAFQSVELDPIDARLEAKAVEKGIPTLVAPPSPNVTAPNPLPEDDVAKTSVPHPGSAAMPAAATPRNRMKALKVELPDYAWIDVKKRAADEMVSLRYFLMDALRAKGIHIDAADMVEDGRRFRD